MGAAPVDLRAPFLRAISGAPCLAAAALQAGASLHHGWSASDLLQNAAESCGGGGSSMVVRIQRGRRRGRALERVRPAVGGLGGGGARAGQGGVVWRDGGAAALRLEEVLQSVAQRSHVLQGVVGHFGQAMFRLRRPPARLWLRPPARLWLRPASCIRLLGALLATTLIHVRAPVSQ